MKRVLVVGGGGREHAIAWACARNRDDVELIVGPGNGGTASIAENVALDVTDADAVARLARDRGVDLVIIGPDAAAAAGVADACIAADVAVFGPTAAAARLESSKAFAKELMDAAGIPTSRWVTGTASDRDAIDAFVAELDGRCAVKADGLALGKGVVTCESMEAAAAALDACFAERRFGDAGARVVVEELLRGPEVSVLGISDGSNVRILPPARDHKRALDGDMGPNTGGMGAVAPPEGVDADALAWEVGAVVLQPCVDEMRRRGTPFTGCLYAGIMLTDDGIRVLEFNARFGDPEAQVVLPLLDEPLLELAEAASRRELMPGLAKTRRATALGVVAAAAGYPEKPRTGAVIDGLDTLDGDVLCFHAGTRRDRDTLRTSGGRVLCVVGIGHEAGDARRSAYANIARVHFEGMRYRSDIGAVPSRQPGVQQRVTA